MKNSLNSLINAIQRKDIASSLKILEKIDVIRDRQGEILLRSVLLNNRDLIHGLRAKGVNVNGSWRGMHAINVAALSLDIGLFMYFAKDPQCDVEARNQDGETPLITLCRIGRSIFRSGDDDYCMKAVRQLVRRKIDLNSTDIFHKTALDHCLPDALCWKKMALYLLNQGADVSAGLNQGAHAFGNAVVFDDRELIAKLAKCSRSLNSQDSSGATPLILAAIHGKFNTAKLLIQHGARTQLESIDQKTALAYAIEHDNLKIVKLLRR